MQGRTEIQATARRDKEGQRGAKKPKKPEKTTIEWTHQFKLPDNTFRSIVTTTKPS